VTDYRDELMLGKDKFWSGCVCFMLPPESRVQKREEIWGWGGGGIFIEGG